MPGSAGMALLAAGAGLLVTLFFIQAAALLAPRVGLVDLPDERKRHVGAVPLVGGLAVGMAYLLVARTLLPWPDMLTGLGAAIFMLMIVGMFDDLYGLSPRVRLLAEIAAALLMIVVGDLQLTSLGNLTGAGDIALNATAGFLFTVFCVVSLVNGVNMLDGVDGLAGSVCATAFTGFLVAAALMGSWLAAAHLGVLIACLASFLLFHNMRTPWRRRLVFLGDAGSMVLGFALAWTAIALADRPQTSMYPITAVWILGLVVLDTIATVIRRLLSRRNPLSAGRDHLHHLLLEAGMPVAGVVGVMVGLSAAMAATGIISWRLGVPEWMLTAGFIALSAVYYSALSIGWRRVSLRGADVIPMKRPSSAVIDAGVMEGIERKAG